MSYTGATVKCGIIDQLTVTCQVGHLPHEKVMQTVRLFGEEIIPAYR